jgi:hypothetical protein
VKRRWLLHLLIVAFLWVVLTRFTEIESLLKTLAQGKWQWVSVMHCPDLCLGNCGSISAQSISRLARPFGLEDRLFTLIILSLRKHHRLNLCLPECTCYVKW